MERIYRINKKYEVNNTISKSKDIGYIDLTFYKEGFSITLQVKAKYRKMGYGSVLLNHVISEAKKERINLYLYIDSHGEMNNRHLSLWYKKLGFRKIDRIYYKLI